MTSAVAVAQLWPLLLLVRPQLIHEMAVVVGLAYTVVNDHKAFLASGSRRGIVISLSTFYAS